MKADLYSALARCSSGAGLAHRTDAGFVVLTSADGAEIISLIESQQNESDLIDQVVARSHSDKPDAFAMLFTAGGDLYLVASGNVEAALTSPTAELKIRPVSGQVLVHPISSGINEADASIELRLDGTTTSGASVAELRAGTVAAASAEIALGAAELSGVPAPAAAETEPAQTEPVDAGEIPAAPPLAEQGLPAAADLVFADDAPSPVAAAPEPEAAATPDPATPEPATPEPVAAVVAVPAEPAPATHGPVMVLGVSCSQGHHNHPDAAYCSQCGTKMGVHHTTVLLNGPRPPLGILVVDDGTTYSLGEDLVIGREPTTHADVIAGTASPMVLADDTLSMSRKHARIVLDDWSVLVKDLDSSNGTFLSRAGQSETWNQLDKGSTSALEPGDRLRIGGRIILVELHHVR